jgi:hypothetical protein
VERDKSEVKRGRREDQLIGCRFHRSDGVPKAEVHSECTTIRKMAGSVRNTVVSAVKKTVRRESRSNRTYQAYGEDQMHYQSNAKYKGHRSC